MVVFSSNATICLGCGLNNVAFEPQNIAWVITTQGCTSYNNVAYSISITQKLTSGTTTVLLALVTSGRDVATLFEMDQL